jgi:phage tail-like protein
MKTVARNKYMLIFLVLALCTVAIGLSSLTAGGIVGGPGGNRTYVSGNYLLEIDGVKCGFVKSFSGGAISAEVINEPVGPDHIVKKHIGQPKYEDITLQIGMSMSKNVYEWIASMMTMNYQRKNGAIIYADYNLNATKRNSTML